MRTAGVQRMSSFLLWPSAYAELYFCDAYRPAFREIDFEHPDRRRAPRPHGCAGAGADRGPAAAAFSRRITSASRGTSDTPTAEATVIV